MQECEQVFNFERYNAFGWAVHRKTVQVGESFTVTYKEDTRTGEFNNITFYTKGLLSIKYSKDNYEGCRDIIDAGSMPALDTEHGVKFMPAGIIMTQTAVEPVEFWCFNYTMNRKKLPTVEKLIIPVGEELTITDKKLFLCRGTALVNGIERSGPIELDILLTATIKAVTTCYGLFFLEERTKGT